MHRILVSRAGSAMAAVCLLRPIPLCALTHYPVPYSISINVVLASRYVPRLRVNLSTSSHATGVKNAEDASRRIARVSSTPSRLRRAKKTTTCQATIVTKQVDVQLHKGSLFEFCKESGKSLLAVVQKADGKKNWIAADQFGNTYSVKPQQVTFIVPGGEDFSPADIASFINKAENLEDASLLEIAWEELVEAKKDTNAEELALICYGDGPLQCYTAHRLLTSQQVFFRCKHKGPPAVYEARSSSQVSELRQQQIAEQAAQEELMVYVNELRTACKEPFDTKPPSTFWQSTDHYSMRTDSLKAYALEASKQPQQKKYAEEVLEALRVPKKPSVAVDLLTKMGVFPEHVNLELLKTNVPFEFSTEILEAAQQVQENPFPDANLKDRVDLTHLKIYTIDSEDADEIDDGLSAVKLNDGQIKVWIHVADPSRWVPSKHCLDKEAKHRSTSIYLPTGTIPMFPMDLASGIMSLRQGCDCCAISISIIFHSDGSMSESEVVCSRIRPTYRLSYDSVNELLSMHVEEEADLYLLADVAKVRRKWRQAQGAIDATVPEANIKVTDPDSSVPSITLSVFNQASPAVQLVTEMMIACGEAVAAFGEQKNISLPYRGQAPRELPKDELDALPEGPCRALASRRYLGRADMSFMKPIQHAALGVPGYVQFTSPIRRYSDLVAHYQVKAVLRGDIPPFSSAYVEAVMAVVNLQSRQGRKLQSTTTRYWSLEYLRRQPRGTCYQALVLRFLKEREHLVLIQELGIQSNAAITSRTEIGSEITVVVDNVNPRKDLLVLQEALYEGGFDTSPSNLPLTEQIIDFVAGKFDQLLQPGVS